MARPYQEVIEENYVHMDSTFKFAQVSWKPFMEW